MTSNYQRVVQHSLAFIEAHPDGVRYIDIKDHVLNKMPDLNANTLSGALNRFRNDLPKSVIRPVRGFYITEDNWKRRDKNKAVPLRVDR
ncbi:MAG: hypothetical protein ACTHOC_01850 [Luteimonas sp.]